MGHGLNVHRVRSRAGRKSAKIASVQKVSLSTGSSENSKRRLRAGAVALTPKSLARVKIIPDRSEAVMTALTDANEARDLIVTQHQLQALKSNPTANVSLTKKQLKKLKNRARACGLFTNPVSKSMDI